MRLGHRDHVDQLADIVFKRKLGSLEVGNKRGEAHVATMGEGADQLTGVRHLGNRPGADEGADLHASDAGVEQRLDDLDLALCRQRIGDRLEAVARGDLDQFDRGG